MGAPRVRYAPSPTGEPHIGNIRSALFNWLFARASGGSFIVRIEDTDQNRLVPGAFDAILDALDWLGLNQDEGPRVGGAYGPYVQSQRLDLYTERAAWLVAQGRAYYCDCTAERLDAMRKAQQEAGRSPGYDRHCRERGLTPVDGTPMVVRFKMPTKGTITVKDRIRGEVSFEAGLLDDFVLLKSDGFPTYHLANVVDDHAMAITHVMRAEEWLPSAPRHQELYEAFGYEMPELVHLPIILGPDRSKLSKRHGATSVRQFQEDGYLPDAMLNFLAMLGWSLDGETDVISRADLERHFSLERVVASPAVFDHAKLDWYNGTYIRALTPGALALQLTPWLEGQGWRVDPDYLARIVPLEQERLKRLSEAPEALAFFFNEPHADAIVQHPPKGLDAATTRRALEAALHTAEHAEEWAPEPLEAAYRGLAEGLGIKTGPLFGAVRVAVTGRTAAPPLFDTLAVLGRERVLARLRAAIGALA